MVAGTLAGSRRASAGPRSRGRATRHVPARLAGSVLAGLSVWAAFPPLDLWPLAAVGVGLAWLAVRGARGRVAALCGFLVGAATFVPLLTWLRTLGVDAWLLLAFSQALWFAAFGAALAAVGRLRWWPLWGAALWVALEAARGRVPFGGFSWGRLAFSQADGPFVAFAALGGAPLVTFAVALAGGLAAWLVVARPRRARSRLGALAALALVAAGGLAVPLGTAGEGGGGRPASVDVAAVQGSVPRLGLHAFAQAEAVVRNHVATAHRLADAVRAGARPRPDLMVWPENSTDLDPYHDAAVRDAIAGAVDAVGAPAMVGAVLDGPGSGHVRNASLVWLPGQQPHTGYVKRHLVPFGEYVPFRAQLASTVGRFSLVPRDFVAGRRSGTVRVGRYTVADAICFEVAYDGIVRQAVTGGGRLLVVQTNDASYEHRGDDGHGGETAQQLAITRLRTVEHGRAAVVAATSGVSALVAPDGTVMQRSGVFTSAVLQGRLPLRDTRTLADRLGGAPEWVLTALGLAAVAAAVIRRALEDRP